MAERVVAVAGFVASENLWVSFEMEWAIFLNTFELPRFHAAKYLSRQRPYAGWSDTKYEAAGETVCTIFRRLNPFGIGNVVDIEVFNEWRNSIEFPISSDPYFFCLDRCLRSLIRGIAQYPKDEGVAIYIDQDKGRESLGVQLAEWNQERLKRTLPENIDPERPVTTIYGSSIDYLPLQAADILVHGSFQWMKNYLLNGKTHPDPYFIECMKQGGVPIHINYFHDKQYFDIETAKRSR